MDWILVTRNSPQPIGAIGFIDDTAAAIVAFYDDKDANKDGDVSLGEWALFKAASTIGVKMNGMNVAEVAMQARGNPMIMERDPSFHQTSGQVFANFAHAMTMDALYKLYFSKGVSAVGSGVAKIITTNMVKQMVIKKGFEKAVKDAFKETVGTGA
jgi:hypothetical protein